MILRSFFCFLTLFFLMACSQDPALGPGVVALVNEKPITLREVEDYHEGRGSALFSTQGSYVNVLQEQYGESLSSLILLTLLEQELEAREMPILPKDIELLEANIRNEYPANMFDEMMQEEFIGAESWRNLLKWRLVVERFNEKILRPNISIDFSEIEAMYEESESLFALPARTKVLVVSGSKVDCEKARASYIVERSFDEELSENLDIEILQLAESRMPKIWLEHIQGKAVGTVSPLFEEEGRWSFCVVEGRSKASKRTLAESYKILEDLVLEEKLAEALEEWYAKRFEKSRIYVSVHLKEIFEQNTAESVQDSLEEDLEESNQENTLDDTEEKKQDSVKAQ